MALDVPLQLDSCRTALPNKLLKLLHNKIRRQNTPRPLPFRFWLLAYHVDRSFPRQQLEPLSGTRALYLVVQAAFVGDIWACLHYAKVEGALDLIRIWKFNEENDLRGRERRRLQHRASKYQSHGLVDRRGFGEGEYF